jgi:hypothetical protein
MTTTQLEDLVTAAVERSVLTTITRHSDYVTESLVEEILKDPATRARLSALINKALDQALANLNASVPADRLTP